MFNVTLYGCDKEGFGSLQTKSIEEIDLNSVFNENVAIVVIEDVTTKMKRYIMGISSKVYCSKCEISGFYKSITYAGQNNSKYWTAVLSFTGAEIFNISLQDVFKILSIIKKNCLENSPFWKINKEVENYIIRNQIRSLITQNNKNDYLDC